MRDLWRRMKRRIASRFLCDRVVFTKQTIVRRGYYLPRGSNGLIVSVCLDGDYQVQFADAPDARLKIHPREVALAPILRGQRRGALSSKTS